MNDLIGDSRTTYHPWQGLSQIPCFFFTDLRKASFLCAYLFIQALNKFLRNQEKANASLVLVVLTH